MRRHWSLVLIPVAACALAAARPRDCGAEFAARWREEAPAGWRRLEECLEGVQARLTLSDVTRSSDPKLARPLESTTALVKLASGRGLVERRSQNFAEAWAFNPEYAFRLSSGGQPASKWNVSFAGASSGKDANYVQADIEWSDVSRFLRAPWQLGISPMRLLAESPHFHVESAAEAPPRNGVRVVELRFTFSPPEKPPAHAMSEMTWMETPMRSGTVSLAPEWSWAILGFDIVSKGGGRTRREVTYDGLVDGFPRLRRVVDRLGGPDVTGERVIRCEVGDWVRREIPPAEFTLAAYGMPEFVAGRNPFLARVTFLIVAIVVVSLALAAGLNFVNKRRRAA